MFFHALVAQVCKSTIKTDCKSIFVDDKGNGKFQQDEFQQLQIAEGSPKKQDQEDFYVDQQEEFVQNQPTIKTMQFNNAMIAPSKIDSSKYQSADPYKINLLKMSNATQNLVPKKIDAIGFNSLGTDTVLLIKGQICKAIGCVILFGSQIYAKHSHQICFMKYDQETQSLYTASEGLKPEIIKWRVEGSIKLQYLFKMNQTKKSIGVATVIPLNQNLILTVDKFNIQKSCELYAFDRNGKKITINSQGSFKLYTKIFDTCKIKSLEEKAEKEGVIVLFVDQIGLKAAMINSSQKMDGNTLEIKQLLTIDKSENYSAVCQSRLFFENKRSMVYLGTRNGQIIPAFVTKDKQIGLQKVSQATVCLHKGWVFQIKSQLDSISKKKEGFSRQLIFSSGAQDNTVRISNINQGSDIKIETLTTVSLDSYAKAISLNDNCLLIGCRDVKIKAYELQVTQKKQAKKIEINKIEIIEKLSFDNSFMVPQVAGQPNDCFLNSVGYNRHSKQFFLTSKNSNKMLILGDASKNSVYSLKGKPSCFDSTEDRIVYVCVQQKTSLKKRAKSKILKQEAFQAKSTIYIENYIEKQLDQKVQLKSKNITCVKFSPDGNFICLGSNDGKITIIQLKEFKQSKNIPKFVEIQQSDQHTSQVKQLIWSQNGDNLQSLTSGQLFFWSFDQKQRKIQKVKPKKIRDIQWKNEDLANLPSFSWESKQLWGQMGLVDDVNQISMISFNSQTIKKRALAVSMYDGKIRFYGYPSKKATHSQIRIFDKKFTIFSQNGILSTVRNGIGIVWKL